MGRKRKIGIWRGDSQRTDQGIETMGNASYTEHGAVQADATNQATDQATVPVLLTPDRNALVRVWLETSDNATQARRKANEAIARAEDAERVAFEAREALRKIAPELFGS